MTELKARTKKKLSMVHRAMNYDHITGKRDLDKYINMMDGLKPTPKMTDFFKVIKKAKPKSKKKVEVKKEKI